LVGSFQDITALKERELNLKASSILPCHLSFHTDGFCCLRQQCTLHAAGIKREDWKAFYGLLLVKISKEHSSNCNFYKVLEG
jgi:hypothetical protein